MARPLCSRRSLLLPPRLSTQVQVPAEGEQIIHVACPLGRKDFPTEFAYDVTAGVLRPTFSEGPGGEMRPAEHVLAHVPCSGSLDE